MNSYMTKRQREIVAWISQYTAAHGRAPTYAEIGVEFAVSKATVWDHVERLVAKGVLLREKHAPRSVRVIEQDIDDWPQACAEEILDYLRHDPKLTAPAVAAVIRTWSLVGIAKCEPG